MMFEMLDYYTMLRERDISIIYSGPIWAGGVEELGNTLRKRLELDAVPFTASLSVFSVFVEQMNNMLMYSSDKMPFSVTDGEKDVSSGVFILGEQGKTYFLQSGNMMQSEQVPAVKERIDYLNTLDKAQLRKYYKEQIKEENKMPGSKGAGLGLIEIAKRASSGIEYKFTPMEDGRTFFAMYVEIGEGGKS